MDSLHTFTATTASAIDAVWRDEAAVTAIEYALLGSLLVLACIGAFTAFGSALTSLYADWIAATLAALVRRS